MIRFSSLWNVCKFALFSSLSHWVCRFVARDREREKKIITLPSRRKETQVRISGPHEFCNDQFYLPYPLQDLSVHSKLGIYDMRLIYTQNVYLSFHFPFIFIPYMPLLAAPAMLRISFPFSPSDGLFVMCVCEMHGDFFFSHRVRSGTGHVFNALCVGAEGEWKANLRAGWMNAVSLSLFEGRKKKALSCLCVCVCVCVRERQKMCM